MPPPDTWHLRAFEPADLDALWRIEADMTRQLAAAGYPPLPDAATDPLAFEARFVGKGVWVAADKAGQPVGFAVAGEMGDLFWLHQLSVAPDYERQGIGSALVMAVINHAKWAFHSAIGVTTFRHLGGSALLYEKAGFLRVETAPLPQLQAQLVKECPAGVPATERVLMVRRL